MGDATACSVRVMVRFRPVNERERNEMSKAQDFSLQFPTTERVEMKVSGASHSFTFDRVYDTKVTQADVYKTCAEGVIADVLNGYNGTIFAYGQTGSGKTFTMYGPDNPTSEMIGIVPRASRQIFQHIQNDKRNVEYSIKAGFVEIYKERVLDLLRPSDQDLKIRESPQKGVWIEGLGEEFVSCEEDILELIGVGERNRSVAATKMNERSSRSHSLFMITIDQKNLDDGSTKSGKMNLVDLAGSEKISKTGAEGNTLEEAKKINQSLSALGNCIHALTEAKRGHVPFRDSKLTRILQESLGGNTKTTLMITASPHPFNAEETVSSLKFGQRAKTIKTNVSVNQQKSVAELVLLVETLKAELTALRAYASRLEKIVAYMRSPDYDPTKPLPAHLTLPEKAPAAAPPPDSGSSSTPGRTAPSSSVASSSTSAEDVRPTSPNPANPARSSDSGTPTKATATPEKRASSRGSMIGASPKGTPKGSSDRRGSTVARPAPIQASPSMTNLLVGVEAFDSFAESRMELAKLKESTAREIIELNEKLEAATSALEEREALVAELKQRTQGGQSEAVDLRAQLDSALAESAKLAEEKSDILRTRNAELDNMQTQYNISKAQAEASEAKVGALQNELVQLKIANERALAQLGALSSLHNTDVLHATNLKEQVQLYAGEVPNTDADTLEQLRAKYEHLYTNVFGQIAEHKNAAIARLEENLKLKDSAENEIRQREHAEQAAKEYQKQLAGMDKKIAEGEAEIRGLHAKIAQASQEHTRAEKELQAAKKEAEAERLAKEDALETVAKLKQLLAEADSRRSRVFRAIRAGETNEDRAKRLGRPLNAFEEKLDYGAILGQLRKTGLKPIDRDS